MTTDALFLVACFLLSALSALNLAAFTRTGHLRRLWSHPMTLRADGGGEG